MPFGNIDTHLKRHLNLDDPFKLLFLFLLFLFHNNTPYSSWINFPSVAYQPLFLFPTWIQQIPITFFYLLEYLWLLLILLSTTRYYSKTFTFLNALIGTLIVGLPQNFGQIYNETALSIVFLWVLFAFEFGKGDKNIKARHTICLTIFCLSMMSAGYQKLYHTGLNWALSENMVLLFKRIIATYGVENYNTLPFKISVFIAESKPISLIIGQGMLWFEFLAPLSLLSKWLRRLMVTALMLMMILVYPVWGLNFLKAIPAFALVLPSFFFNLELKSLFKKTQVYLFSIPIILVMLYSTDYFWPFSRYSMYSWPSRSCLQVFHLWPSQEHGEFGPGNKFYKPLDDMMYVSYIIQKKSHRLDYIDNLKWMEDFTVQYAQYYKWINSLEDGIGFKLYLSIYDLNNESFYRPQKQIQILELNEFGKLQTVDWSTYRDHLFTCFLQ